MEANGGKLGSKPRKPKSCGSVTEAEGACQQAESDRPEAEGAFTARGSRRMSPTVPDALWRVHHGTSQFRLGQAPSRKASSQYL